MGIGPYGRFVGVIGLLRRAYSPPRHEHTFYTARNHTMIPTEYSFTRYLAAKRSVDDRALSRQAWERLAEELAARRGNEPLRILELGCGIGTMFERLAMAGLIDRAHYTAIDFEPENINLAYRRLREWGRANGLEVAEMDSGMVYSASGREIRLELAAVDVFDFARAQTGRQVWDLLVANAFLDLVDLPASLPHLFQLLKPGGLFYFTLNFDGVTALEPPVDPDLDHIVEQVYHRTMDERRLDGKPSGDSHTGRHLFAYLRAAGAQLLEAGGSDWLVYPGKDGYPGDEAYFLHFIIQTIFSALYDRPEIDPASLAGWAACRHEQVERGELVYVAHQLDFLGVRPEVAGMDWR
jgi:SAM-dependent methyltransferase